MNTENVKIIPNESDNDLSDLKLMKINNSDTIAKKQQFERRVFFVVNIIVFCFFIYLIFTYRS